jgi:hypothetical protein
MTSSSGPAGCGPSPPPTHPTGAKLKAAGPARAADEAALCHPAGRASPQMSPAEASPGCRSQRAGVSSGADPRSVGQQRRARAAGTVLDQGTRCGGRGLLPERRRPPHRGPDPDGRRRLHSSRLTPPGPGLARWRIAPKGLRDRLAADAARMTAPRLRTGAADALWFRCPQDRLQTSVFSRAASARDSGDCPCIVRGRRRTSRLRE